MTDWLTIAAVSGLVAGLVGFCFMCRFFADLDPSDEFIDELTHGEQPRLSDGFSPHVGKL